MMTTYNSPIIREEYLDDGSTTGEKIYQTADGRWWRRTWSTKETAGTGETIGTLEGGKIKW